MNDLQHCFAFGDIFELEHVCEMLSEQAALPAKFRDPPDYLTGEKSYIFKRLANQDSEGERLIERERPGLYRRTWIFSLFYDLFHRLGEVTLDPETLPVELSTILLQLHKVQIAAHHVFDDWHREQLLKNLSEQAPYADRGRKQLDLMKTMQVKGKVASTRYPASNKDKWRQYDQQKQAARAMNVSDRVRAVIREFELDPGAYRTVRRALTGK